MEQILIGIIAVILNILTIFLTVTRMQIKNREDITRLETQIEHIESAIEKLEAE